MAVLLDAGRSPDLSRPPILDLVLPSEMAVVVDSELLKQLQEILVAERATFITEFLQREVQGFLRLAQPLPRRAGSWTWAPTR